MTDSAQRPPHPVDRHVGIAIRLRRRFLRMSQETLADKLGLTFQQIQKYEKGDNRVSASKLHEIAEALETPIGYFFEGLSPDDQETVDQDAVNDLLAWLSTHHGMEMAETWRKLKPQSQKTLLQFMRTLVETDEAEDELDITNMIST